MTAPLWFVTLAKKLFPLHFLLARFSKVPLVGRLVEYMLFEGDDMIYLPKDRVIQVGVSIQKSEDIVLPSGVLEHFIEESNYHWIMDFCLCRASSQCEDYPQEIGCIFLGEAVLKISPKLGRLVSKEQALMHARRAREAGLVHLIGRNKIDTLWLGARPGSKLLTICNCCPCCCLWKMLPNVSHAIGGKVTSMPGVHVEVTERCVGCGTCTGEVCFVDAIHLEGDRALISDACRGCGRCVELCPSQAIELTLQDDRFLEETIARLSPLVDLK